MTTATLDAPVVDTPQAPAITPGQLVAGKTIALVLNIGKFGNSRKASMAAVTVDADKKLLRLSKTLLDSPEFVAIQKFDTALTAKIRKLALTSYFKGGVYLIPLTQVTEINQILTDALPVRNNLIDVAVAAYPQRVAETSERLGDVANPADYPPAERFRNTFYLDYRYVTFETPSRLKAISAAIWQSEVEKAQAKLDSVAGEMQQAARAMLLKLVGHLKDRLQPDVEGKDKRLHKTAITHLTDFLDTFDLRNVTDDKDLADIVGKARDIMKGVDPKMIKSDELIKTSLLAQLDGVAAALDPLVEDEATRLITFDDDDN